MRDLVLFVGWEEVSGLEMSSFSLFVSNKYPLSFSRRDTSGKLAYHVYTGNLYTKSHLQRHIPLLLMSKRT